MNAIYSEGRKLIASDAGIAADTDMPTEMRMDAKKRIAEHSVYMEHPAESIRWLMDHIEKLRLALGSIAYTERGEGLTAEAMLQHLREQAKRAAEWSDKLPDDGPALEVVK